MRWNIHLINSQKREEDLEIADKVTWSLTDFDAILKDAFPSYINEENDIVIKQADYSIRYNKASGPERRKILKLNGPKGFMEIVKLGRREGWQVYDSGLQHTVDYNLINENNCLNFDDYLRTVLSHYEDIYPQFRQTRKLPFYPCHLHEEYWEGKKRFSISIDTCLILEFDYMIYQMNSFAGGGDWEDLIIYMIKAENWEYLIPHLDFNSETSTFLVGTHSNEIQLKLANLIHENCKDHRVFMNYCKEAFK